MSEITHRADYRQALAASWMCGSVSAAGVRR